jgi:GMP synthase-like glutamine amidotransferase
MDVPKAQRVVVVTAGFENGVKMRIVYLRHVPFEGLAGIGTWAEGRGHEVRAVRMFAGEVPPEPDGFDWLIVMGGPMDIHDDSAYPWLEGERRFIRRAIDAGRLVLGVCLGAQFVADALGARVFHNPSGPEIGWFDIRPTPEAAGSVTFAGVPDRATVFHWHGDTFDLPAGAVRLAESDVTEIQAFEACDGRVLAMQFHPEATPASVLELSRAEADELAPAGRPHVQSAGELLSGAALHQGKQQELLADILGRMERLHPVS